LKKPETNYVPCNGCTLCCKGDLIRLTANDNPAKYITEPHPRIPGALMLAHKENGDCIYLEESGCSIHGSAPELCRSADCRSLALKYDFNTAMQMHNSGLINILVWDKGNDLLNELRKQ
jgi:hypothetical protein